MKLLVEQYPADAKEGLVRVALRNTDPAVQATAINLVSLCRDESVLARLEPLLKDGNTTEDVRCAVLDCIGFTRFPAYEVGHCETVASPKTNWQFFYSLPATFLNSARGRQRFKIQMVEAIT